MIIRQIAAEIDRVVVSLHYATVGRHHQQLEPLANAVGIQEREQCWDLAEFLAAGACTEDIARRRFPYDPGDDAAVMLAKLRSARLLDEENRPNTVLGELLTAILQAQEETAATSWPDDLAELQRFADSAFGAATGPLVEAFRALPVLESPGYELLYTLTGIRYGRHDAHIEAWRELGLSGPDMAALGAAAGGQTLVDTPQLLADAGLVDDAGHITVRGSEVRSEIEHLTDEGCRPMYAAVDDLEAWLGALRAMPGRI